MQKIQCALLLVSLFVVFSCGDEVKKYYNESDEGKVYEEIMFEPVYSKGTQPQIVSPTGIASPAGEGKPIISKNDLQFKDLNNNGKLDPYEDWRLSPDERADDLVSQMTIEEKAGLLMHGTPTYTINEEHSFEVFDDSNNANDLWSHVTEKQIRFAIGRFGGYFGGDTSAKNIAHYMNSLQKLCEMSRLGIPFVVSQDPGHSPSGAGPSLYSKWPSSLGLGATADPENTYNFARIASKEMRGIGVRMSLHPQIDTPTDPRWVRQIDSFVEGFEKNAQHAAAYVKGFQGDTLSPDSNVLVCVKHFPGGGSCEGGNDAHKPEGKWAVYPGDHFRDHLLPFERAFDSGALCTMPYFSMPKNIGFEEVGMGFNWDITTGVLRNEMQFQGFVLTDWEILRDSQSGGTWPTTCNGVETLSKTEKVAKVLHAGSDQFGGWSEPQDIIDTLAEGLITEEDLNRACKNIIRVTMRLGIFENPYTDESVADSLYHTDETNAAILDVMQKSIVLLKNGTVSYTIFGSSSEDLLPIEAVTDDYNSSGQLEVYYDGKVKTGATAGNDLIANYGVTPVGSPELADYAVIRVKAPNRTTSTDIAGYVFYSLLMSEAGQADLQKIQDARAAIEAADSDTKLVVVMHNTRPAIPSEFISDVDCYLVEYGVNDEAILNLLFSKDGVKPTGKLPLEIPSSMEAVIEQWEDTPADSYQPAFTLYSGLTYE